MWLCWIVLLQATALGLGVWRKRHQFFTALAIQRVSVLHCVVGDQRIERTVSFVAVVSVWRWGFGETLRILGRLGYCLAHWRIRFGNQGYERLNKFMKKERCHRWTSVTSFEKCESPTWWVVTHAYRHRMTCLSSKCSGVPKPYFLHSIDINLFL